MSHVRSVNQPRRAMPSRQEKATYRKDANGNYHFYGTSKNDKISVYRQNDKIHVRVNNREMKLTPEQAKNMVIHAQGGNDQVVIGKGVPKGVRVHGGSGRDTMVNLSHGARLDGGRGNDCIVSYGNNCQLRGSKGNDAIASFGRGGNVRTSTGRDHVYANHGTHVHANGKRDHVKRAPSRRTRHGGQMMSKIRTMLDNFFFGNVRS